MKPKLVILQTEDNIKPEPAKKQPLCFVVMGFGTKTDYESGRTFDLDKTFEHIIKPASEAAGFRTIRADEVAHSSIIDVVMYDMLYGADLVIADISTANPNAIYELGVRHALRPHATIIMKESQGKYFFDLNHDSTLNYRHLGEDIGASEAKRASNELRMLINAISVDQRVDSPVHTYLPRLNRPLLSEAEVEEALEIAEGRQQRLTDLTRLGDINLSNDQFSEAYDCFSKALEIKPSESYLRQRMVLAKYKSKKPSEISALTDAIVLLDRLEPDTSNDPETLGLAGSRALYINVCGWQLRTRRNWIRLLIITVEDLAFGKTTTMERIWPNVMI